MRRKRWFFLRHPTQTEEKTIKKVRKTFKTHIDSFNLSVATCLIIITNQVNAKPLICSKATSMQKTRICISIFYDFYIWYFVSNFNISFKSTFSTRWFWFFMWRFINLHIQYIIIKFQNKYVILGVDTISFVTENDIVL